MTTETTAGTTRIDLLKHSGAAYEKMLELAQTVHAMGGLEYSLQELVKIRASQINGCAMCLDMHTLDAAAAGETHQRMHALNAWRETPFFTERERAALALTEAGTLLANGGVSDEVYAEAAAHFDENELAALTWLIAIINTFNRLAVTTRMMPGSHTPQAR
ncbi:carboxymuconolactone decarboxylase family protein [Streptomyces sp. ISL-98]|uniref:carboxymuconolactone decarboxylase family protein n=1 Tax=Streptomyces sp. ISL-98 TaxID=2819192 RepID=UPI001BE7CE76|nr:carboxymuconolactone decarboxylase family protein [Streptomyces sp. ISL-98]